MQGIVPELTVSDWRASRRFYVDVLGFRALYERPEEGFVFLELGPARLMIDQIGIGRDFGAPSDRPFGQGVNLSIPVVAIDPILTRLEAAGVPLAVEVEERWYRRDDAEIGQRQFVVADPDGYLLRPFEPLGERPVG